jgi:hypothetical protein
MPARIDWEAVEREYRAGQLSLREIGRRHEISEGLVRKRAKKDGWERDLAAKVREKIKAEMVRADLREATSESTAEEAINAAAARGVEVLTLHRRDIAILREQEQRLLAELGDVDNPPLKTWMGQYQGSVIEHAHRIPVTERASALQALASVQHKRIALERQAYSLDDEKESASDSLADALVKARERWDEMEE